MPLTYFCLRKFVLIIKVLRVQYILETITNEDLSRDSV